MEERRRYERLKVEEHQSKGNINGSERSVRLDIFDLSPDGLGFIIESKIAVGQELSIELNVEDEMVFCKAKVCWIKSDVVDPSRAICGARLKISNLYDQSKLLLSYTNKLLNNCPLPANFIL